MKHLWLKLPPFWAATDPSHLSFEGWNTVEAHARCTVAECSWLQRRRDDPAYVEPPPNTFRLVAEWLDAPKAPEALEPVDDGVVLSLWLSNVDPLALLRNGHVTLCGKLDVCAPSAVASQASEATCVDCLHKLEVDRDQPAQFWSFVIPYDHPYRACSPMCRRCYAHDAQYRKLVTP